MDGPAPTGGGSKIDHEQGSVMRINRDGCIRPTPGAACAAASNRARISSGTFSPVATPHGAAFGDGAVHGVVFGVGERVVGHSAQGGDATIVA